MPKPEGAVPASNVALRLSAPEVTSTENPVTVPSNWLATYKNFPSGVTATDEGPGPEDASVGAAGKGEPATSVSVVSLIEKTEMVAEVGSHCRPWFATNKK